MAMPRTKRGGPTAGWLTAVLVAAACSGSAGSATTAAPETVAEDVHNFNLTALTRSMIAPPLATGSPSGGNKLLLVVTDAASPTPHRANRMSPSV